MPTGRQIRTGLLLAVMGSLAGALIGGCGETIRAKYALPANKTVAILVDDPRGVIAATSVAHDLHGALARDLREHSAAKEVLRYDRTQDALHADPALARVPLARRLGADIAIYIRVVAFCLKDTETAHLGAEAGAFWRGSMEVLVQVIDVSAAAGPGRVLWPEDRADGYPLVCRKRTTSADTRATYGVQLAQRLAATMARGVGNLLHDRKVAFEYWPEPEPEIVVEGPRE